MERRIKECPECKGSIIIDPEKRESFCAVCGLVLEEKIINPGPEWRAFNNEQIGKRSRIGQPQNYRLVDKGLGTAQISYNFKNNKLWNMQRRTRTVIGIYPKTLSSGLLELDRMACMLKLPKEIKEASAFLYRKALEADSVRGRSIEEIASAVLFIVCRNYKIPRTFKEIEKVSRVRRKKISNAYIFLQKKLNIKILPVSPVDFVPRFCSSLNLNKGIESEAIKIIKQAEKQGITNGQGPIGAAAAAIYIATIVSGESRTQKEVANVSGVTEVTIRNRFKEISEKLDLEHVI